AWGADTGETPRDIKSAPTKKVAKKRTQPEKPTGQAEPLAVLERKLKLTGHTGWVQSVAISPDGQWVASGSDDKTVNIWDLETGKHRATLKGHTDQVNCVSITPDAKRIVSGSNDASVRVWDAASGQNLGKLDGHTTLVRSLVALSDSDRVFSGQDILEGVTLKLWELDSHSCITTIQCGT